MAFIQSYAGHDAAPPATPDERQTLADLSLGEMLAILQIAGTIEGRRAATLIGGDNGAVLQPNREAFMRITVRGLARVQGNGYMLTTRGQFVGTALIATIERQSR